MRYPKVLRAVVFVVGVSLIGLFGTWPVFLGLLMFRWASETAEYESVDLHNDSNEET